MGTTTTRQPLKLSQLLALTLKAADALTLSAPDQYAPPFNQYRGSPSLSRLCRSLVHSHTFPLISHTPPAVRPSGYIDTGVVWFRPLSSVLARHGSKGPRQG